MAAPIHFGGRVLAARSTGVYQSDDAGCTWQHIYESPEPLQLAAPGYPWYTYGIGARGDTLYRFALPPFGPGIAAVDLPFQVIDVYPARFSTLHMLAQDGRIMRLVFHPFDVDWEEVGSVPPGVAARYIAINHGSAPVEPTHIILTMTSGPPWVTLDDGASWAESEGIRKDADFVTTGRAHFSNQVHQVGFKDMEVWIAVRREWANPGTGDVVVERVIARSTDRGLTFTDVVVHDGNAVVLDDALFDDFPLATRRNVAGEIYFATTGCPAAEPRLYRYRVEDESLTVLNWNPGELAGIEFVEFLTSQWAPDVLYIGHRAIDTCD